MPATVRHNREILNVFNKIEDEKVRYFFLMLGEAIADHRATSQHAAFEPPRANTSAAHLAELEKRLSTKS
jgi:hypothetical protein